MAEDRDAGVPEGVEIVETGIAWTIDAASIEWEDINIQRLPAGIEQTILYRDDATGRIDKIIKFPAGYVEPEHTHEAEHATMILDGRMLLHGHELTSGDYLFGPGGKPHGPMRYPDGCIVFSSSIGGSIEHDWDELP